MSRRLGSAAKARVTLSRMSRIRSLAGMDVLLCSPAVVCSHDPCLSYIQAEGENFDIKKHSALGMLTESRQNVLMEEGFGFKRCDER